MANSHSPTENRLSSYLPGLELHSLITIKMAKSERQKEVILGLRISSNQKSRDTHMFADSFLKQRKEDCDSK